MTAPVRIESRVLVGTGSIILKGVSIGADSVVGAGAVISPYSRFPERSSVGGNPAVFIAEIGGWIP
ncbi:DapH/DapD/GlmU-related protein [Rathayibacter sp. YIM 133350]|uniref:DapH/DapD/GlmU-related protein n=1 Tax=Rathayibacter sp. YIM 133350 TaxID=3131992 RepID=UPI003FD2D923